VPDPDASTFSIIIIIIIIKGLVHSACSNCPCEQKITDHHQPTTKGRSGTLGFSLKPEASSYNNNVTR
jgi:hypothetical protein